MRGSFALLLLLSLSTLVLPTAPLLGQEACPPPDSASSQGSIVGTVVDAETRTPLGFSRLRLMAAGLAVPLVTRADPSGRFRFCEVPAGPFSVSAQLAQLGAVYGPEDLGAGQARSILLEMAPATTGRVTGTLTGVVLEAGTGTPVDGATVTLPDLGQTRVTNSHGRFTFSSIPPGGLKLVVDRLGYRDAAGEVTVRAGSSVNTQVTLSSEPITLEPIQVTAVRRRLNLPGLDEFERRLNSGWGRFILEEDIRIRSPIRLTQILNEYGVTGSEKGIRMRRTGCAPLVYVDGVKVTHLSRGGGPEEPRGGVHPMYLWPDPDASPDAEAAVAVNSVLPSHVQAVEVYRGPGETPGQYLDSNSMCGVILIWTRRGNLPGE